MRRVFVTGAEGALGRVLVSALRERSDCHVVASARRMSQGHVFLDVTRDEDVQHVMGDYSPDLIFHLAGSFADQLHAAVEVNVMAADNILRAAGRARVVLVGSAAEYGRVSPEENPIKECQPLRPMTVYGLTKSWQTQLGMMRVAHGVDVVVARLFNLYAENMSARLFIGQVQRQIREFLAGERGCVEVGSLEAVRDYVTASEAVRQLIAIGFQGISGSIYNIGSGKPTRMKDVLARMLVDSGLSMDIVSTNSKRKSHQVFDVPVAYADLTRTRSLLDGCA